MSHKRSSAAAYLISATGLVVAILLSLAFKPLVHETPTLFFLAAVVVSARWAGLRAAALTIVLSVLALDYFFIEPIYSIGLALADMPIVTMFVLVALLVSSLNEASLRAEAALARANEELEEKVADRTRELVIANEKEQQARGEAEAANREKDVFLAMVSHELRTPLNAIIGWTHILQRDLQGSEHGTAVEVIERNAQVQARLIGELLDAGRIISGKLQLERRPASLALLVEEVVVEMAPLAAAKAINLERSVSGCRDQCAVDADRIRQILTNLISNSIKFTPPGGVVRITLAELGDTARIEVSDTGRGIAPEFLPYVFERFKQRDDRDRRAGGLGLGLAIVSHLVELHGGRITASSEGEGKGSTFQISLPLVEAARHLPAGIPG